MLVWSSVWSEVQTCIWPSRCHCHSQSLALVKSRLILPFWYRLTRVVPDKEPLNVCVCVFLMSKCVIPVNCFIFPFLFYFQAAVSACLYVQLSWLHCQAVAAYLMIFRQTRWWWWWWWRSHSVDFYLLSDRRESLAWVLSAHVKDVNLWLKACCDELVHRYVLAIKLHTTHLHRRRIDILPPPPPRLPLLLPQLLLLLRCCCYCYYCTALLWSPTTYDRGLFHAHAPLSATEVSLSQDRVRETVYRLL